MRSICCRGRPITEKSWNIEFSKELDAISRTRCFASCPYFFRSKHELFFVILVSPSPPSPSFFFFFFFFPPFLRQSNSLEKQSSRLFFRKIHDDTTLPFVARHIVSRLLSSYVLRQRYVGAAFVYPDFKPCLQFQLRWSAITFVPDPRPSYPIYPFESKKYRTPKMPSVRTFLFSNLLSSSPLFSFPLIIFISSLRSSSRHSFFFFFFFARFVNVKKCCKCK